VNVKSYLDRVTALELLEAAEAAEPDDLTDSDVAKLIEQLGMGNVQLDHGRALRRWRTEGEAYLVELDRAIERLNALIEDADEPPRDTRQLLCGLLNLLPLAMYPDWLEVDGQMGGGDETIGPWIWGQLARMFPGVLYNEEL